MMNPDRQVDVVVERLRRKGYRVDRSKEIQPIQRTFTPKGVLLHHTASSERTSREAELSDISYMNRDQPGWPAPHSQFYVGRTATIYVLAAGCAYHAGSGNGLVKQGIPADLGNQYLWGIEVQDDGYGRDWPDEQWLAVHALTGELVQVMDVPVNHVWDHEMYDDDSGKVDTRYPIDKHREAVRRYLNNQQEEPMQKEDFEKIEQIVNKAIDAKTDDIARAVLSSDLSPKDDESMPTVRRALRKVLGL